MLLFLVSCVWISDDEHSNRVLPGLNLEVDAVAPLLECGTPGWIVEASLPRGWAGRTVDVELVVDGESLVQGAVQVVSGGAADRLIWQQDVPRAPLEPQRVSLRAEYEGIPSEVDLEVETVAAAPAWIDVDGDGFGSGPAAACAENSAAVDGDCNDGNATIFPGAEEGVADGIDQDCDSLELCAFDVDLDGFTSEVELVEFQAGCQTPTPLIDCDDLNTAIHPDAVELPFDDVDDNCDGLWACGIDDDADGFQSQTLVDQSTPCALPTVLDCNDLNAVVFPGAAELCDGVDNDCDSATGDAFTATPPHVAITLADLALDLQADTTVELCSTQLLPQGEWTLQHDLTVDGTSSSAAALHGSTRILGAGGTPPRLTLRALEVSTGTGIEILPAAIVLGGAISVENVDVTLEGAEVSRGNPAVPDFGGALAIKDGSLVLRDVTFDGLQAANGGAVALGGSTLVLDTSQGPITFANNMAGVLGGALHVDSGSTIQVLGPHRPEFVGNSGGGGAAIALSFSAVSLSDTGLEFRDNMTVGGAIDVRSSAFSCAACVFTANLEFDVTIDSGPPWTAMSDGETNVTCDSTECTEASPP